MKTIQFNANQILNRNHQPITHNGVIIMASNMVIISTGHDDSIISDPEGYQEYDQCEPIVNYVNNTFIITDIYSW